MNIQTRQDFTLEAFYRVGLILLVLSAIFFAAQLSVEGIAFLILFVGVPALVLYWIIRLAVRHGSSDSRRPLS